MFMLRIYETEYIDYPDYICILTKINNNNSDNSDNSDSGYEDEDDNDNDETFKMLTESVLVSEQFNTSTGILLQTWKPPQKCYILGAHNYENFNLFLNLQNAFIECEIPHHWLSKIEHISENIVCIHFPSQYKKNVIKTKFKYYFSEKCPTTVMVI
jgi:hypothetical protein